MPGEIPRFSRKPPGDRRRSLVDATIACVAEDGVKATTVRAIAGRAGVTQGLIRHHFASKEALVAAAYDHHMARMTGIVSDAAGPSCDPPALRLARFVAASLSPPVMSAEWVGAWAGFLGAALHDPGLARAHDRTYRGFRDLLEALIGETLLAAGRTFGPSERRRLAVTCNALIDGLWIEGGAGSEGLAEGDAARLGAASVSALLGIDLPDPGGQKETA